MQYSTMVSRPLVCKDSDLAVKRAEQSQLQRCLHSLKGLCKICKEKDGNMSAT
jgi:hypothetical protein